MNDVPTTSHVATAEPVVELPAPPKLKFEFGMELTWCGKALDIFKKGEDAIKLAFPIAADTVTIEEVIVETVPEIAALPVEEQAAAAEAVVEQQADPTLTRLLGMNVEQMKFKFMQAGLGEDYSEREAKRLAKEFVLFDLGVINHIDPYKSGSVEKSSNTAWERKRIILDAELTSGRNVTGNRRNPSGRNDTDTAQVITPSNAAQVRLTDRIVTCLKDKWEPVGYRDKIGVVGVQWNGEREIEVTSFVHRTMEQAEIFYRTATAGFEALGVKMETAKDAGGGGHLHVTYNKRGGGLKKDTMFNLVWDTIARPYINWAFNDPNDATTSRAPIDAISHLMGNGQFNFGKGAAVRWASPGHRLAPPEIDEEYGSVSNYTTEFRLFQMPKTWEEQRLHIEFVEAWAGAADRGTYMSRLGPIRPFKGGKARAWKSAEQCLNELGEFMVNVLELDYHAYRPIIEKNLVTKFTHYGHELT